MISRFMRFSQSLSTRLLCLTAIWVTFIVTSIGYTMMLSWKFECASEVVTQVTNMRAQIYRAHILVDPRFENKEFQDVIVRFKASMNMLRDYSIDTPFSYRIKRQVSDQIELIEREWGYVVLPLLQEARSNGLIVDSPSIEHFALRFSQIERELDQERGKLLWQMRYIQMILIGLAVGSLFVIMYLLLRWVIRPTECLQDGMKKLTDGNLFSRVNLERSSLEFQRIGNGFNRMAARLQDLVENLESKVKEKTEAVEDKNRDLAQLYEVTTYLGETHSVDDMCEGFTGLLMHFTQAKACGIWLINRENTSMELVASSDLPSSMFSRMTRQPLPLNELKETLSADSAIRLLDLSSNPHWGSLGYGTSEAGYRDAYLMHIRNGNKPIGIFVLYYDDDRDLDQQTCRLYENFGSHLGVAIDNRRLIERDQQYAVVQERNLMAQGLHDSIAQSLSFLNLQVQFLESGLKADDKAFVDDTVAQIKEGVKQSYEDVRELLLNFRERIHSESFAEAISMVVNRFENQTGLHVEVNTQRLGAELTDKQKLQVIFIMQEALANVRKHSQASLVRIDIDNAEDFFICVSDNGVGIDPALLEKRKARHVGMNIMRERAERIHASVKIDRVDPSIFPSGTSVSLTIPASERCTVH